VSARLYAPGAVTAPFQAALVALWLLVALADLRPMGIAVSAAWRCLGSAAVALLAHALCPALGWHVSLAIAIMLCLASSLVRLMLRRAAGRNPLRCADGWRGAGLLAVVVFALHPYVVSAQVGAGDAYHYSLMLADAVGQLRAGVFPLFVGQTSYAFNGNIHTLRTAPLYEYLGGGLDYLTLHTLPIVGLQGLILFSTGSLAALGCYASLRRYAPGSAWEAAGLAGLFVLGPGILAPLYEGDMVATFLTIAILPWLVACLARASDEPGALMPWIGQAAALAALWWAHPPVAFWSTLLAIGADLLILARTRSVESLVRTAGSALLFLLLAGYVFVSVATLELRPNGAAAAQQAANVIQSDSQGWLLSLLPLGEKSFLGNIQLGYSLMACVLVGLLAFRSRRSAATLLAAAAAFLALLYPIPGLTFRLWAWAPLEVLTVTNSWPAQRFGVILAALAVFLAMAGLSTLPRRRGARILVGLCFAGALAWSIEEAGKLVRYGTMVTSTRDRTELLHRPDNVSLTRSSYLIFNFFPPYFSHGVMSPLLETRIVDPKTFDVVADGSTPAPGLPAPTPSQTLDIRGPDAVNKLSPGIRLAPGHTSLLSFDFMGRQPPGTLQILGPGVSREYILPSSGSENSFGSGPTNSRVIAITNDTGKPEDLSLLFYPSPLGTVSKDTFARVSVDWLDSSSRAVSIRSLVPFEAEVRSKEPGFLETPKVFVPGYRATLNGHAALAVPSRNGLVAVPIPAGLSLVRIDYPGLPVLRLAFWASAAGWVGLAGALLIAGGTRRPVQPLPQGARRWVIPAAAFIALALIGIGLWSKFGRATTGPIRLVLMLPLAKAGSAQPLVTTGKTGAGDTFYVKFLGNGKIAVGHDKWSYGGQISDPIDVDWTKPQTVEIEAPSLGSGEDVRISWNGRPVINDPIGSYVFDKSTSAEIGANDIGASTCEERFTGRILRRDRETASVSDFCKE
jgi:hypothetical protein